MAASRASATAFERITSEEFEQMPEFQDILYELIEGKIEKKAMPGGEHAKIVKRIVRSLIAHDPDEKIGECWFDVSFKIDDYWSPIPDLAFVVAKKAKPVTQKAIDVVPDLVVEVNSPEDLNTVKKREKVAAKIAKYQENGVSIIWSITPTTQTVAVYHPNQIEPVQVLEINGELEGENIIPGFKMKVADLFH